MKKTIAGIRALFGRKGKAAAAVILIELLVGLLVKYADMDVTLAHDVATTTLYVGLAYIGSTAAEDFAKHLKGNGGAPKSTSE